MTTPTVTVKVNDTEVQATYYSGGLVTGPVPVLFKGLQCFQPYVAPETALNSLYSDVRKFHVAFNHPAPNEPTMQPLARANTRGEWIIDEVNELKDARTLVDQADAYIDIIYFAVGGLVELGVKPKNLWDIVQRANMAKLGPDGKPLYHPDGKTKKPEGWVAPEPQLMAEVRRQVDEATARKAFP